MFSSLPKHNRFKTKDLKKCAVPRYLFSQTPRNKHVTRSKRGIYFYINRVTTQKSCVFRELEDIKRRGRIQEFSQETALFLGK